MLSFNVTHTLKECNAALPKLYATQIQAALFRKLVESNGKLSEVDPPLARPLRFAGRCDGC